MTKIKVALIGAGQRGKDVYGNYVLSNSVDMEFVAVAEPNKIKREEFCQKHNISKEWAFESYEELLEKEKFCDAVIIATPDRMHFVPAKLSLEKGYHILLEKPMSNNPKEVVELGRLAQENDNVFMICHVLRYTPFYSRLKKIVDSGVIGKVISIQHNENIGYAHFAHSFVRGNWRNSEESSPLMVQKSCHDMDIFLWLVGSDCTDIASFGSLSHFRPEERPEGEADRCIDNEPGYDSPYLAQKTYYDNIGRWPTTVITEIQTKENVDKALAEGPYGRSVYACDNNVVDHQGTILDFENGVNVVFNLSAFTNRTYRNMKIMGSHGEIIGDDLKNEIQVELFGAGEKTIITPKVVSGGHGGGDTGIMEDFISLIKSNPGVDSYRGLTAASISVQSHIMAFAAEEARVTKQVINLEEYINRF